MILADDLDGSGTDAFPRNELDEGVAPISIRIEQLTPETMTILNVSVSVEL
jgi:hypothetical protein